MNTPTRKHLPTTRASRTAKLQVAGHEFYVTASFYPNEDQDKAELGEVFVKAAKHGADMSLFVDGWATAVSVALQYGVPWSKFYEKFLHTQGATRDMESPSVLHALVEGVQNLIDEYRQEFKCMLEECRQQCHEQQSTQPSDPEVKE